MNRVEVTRSSLRMWLVALLGVPLVFYGIQVLTRGELLAAFARAVYGASDVPAYEPRDIVWAILFLVVGSALFGFGIKELLAPRRLVVADEAGLCLALLGPVRHRSCLPWEEIRAVSAGPGPVLAIVVGDPSRLPARPWGARWVDDSTLLVSAGSWSPPAERAAPVLDELREAHREVGGDYG